MVAAIKQLVTVNSDNSITIRDASLPPGAIAEVIVLLDEATSKPATKDEFLAAFEALQKSMNLDATAAERWAAENRKLREWNRPPV